MFGETADEIFGLAGNDTLDGYWLSDILWGDEGDDILRGGDGNDTLYGGPDNDVLQGDGAFAGDTGNDFLSGEDGHDYLNGGDDDDILWGGEGDDELFGNAPYPEATDADQLDGGPGNDRLVGTSGPNTIDGGTGHDTASIYFLNATLPVEFVALVPGATVIARIGGQPHGMVTNVEAYAQIWGGQGNDTLGAAYVLPAEAQYTLSGLGGDDIAVLDLSAETGRMRGSFGDGYGYFQNTDTNGLLNVIAEHIHYTGNALENVTTGDGNDRLTGVAGADTFDGGRGHDTITGGGGADALRGGEGDDIVKVPDTAFAHIDGGTGTDTLELTGGGVALDLAAPGQPRVLGIERIDLTGTGHNTLALTASAVLAMDNATNQLLIDGNTGDSVTFADTGWQQGATADGRTTYTNAGATLAIDTDIAAPPCFAAGTRILTPHGEIPVEALREGDLVVVHSAPGTRPVRWLGHRRLRLAGHPRPWDVQPIRVHAHAFAPGQPHRDLRLSPDHAIHADGVLIPIRYLLNGATITQETMPDVTYHHVELAGPNGAATHDILFADGLETESYLDTGNRAAFANGGPVATLHPDFGRDPWDAGCAPLMLEGPEVEALRVHLLAQATTLGHAISRDPALHLVVDGAIVAPSRDGTTYRFALPPRARDIRLVSRTTSPAETRPESRDTRRLGVAVTRLALDATPLPLDDARLAGGWHPSEADLRWTTGNAALAVAGCRTLEINVASLESYWVERMKQELNQTA